MAPTKDLFLILRVTSHVRGELHIDVRTQCGIMTLAGEEFGGGGGGYCQWSFENEKSYLSYLLSFKVYELSFIAKLISVFC